MQRVNIVVTDDAGDWTIISEPYDSDSLPIVMRQLPDIHPGAEVLVLPGAFTYSAPELVVFDVDSTLINEEVIDLIAAAAGVGEEVAAVTERAMAGQLDFSESLAARVALLAGTPAGVLDEVRQLITPTTGVQTFIDSLHEVGATVAAVSGGFIEIVQPLADDLGLDAAFANAFEIDTGVLTGRTRGQVVDRKFKADTLRALAAQMGADPALTVAVGDGANDIDMLQAAGCGVAFCAKQALVEKADVALNIRDMGILAGIFATPFRTSRYELS